MSGLLGGTRLTVTPRREDGWLYGEKMLWWNANRKRKRKKTHPSLILLDVDVWNPTQIQVSPLLCGLEQQHTGPHSSLSALMMCVSAGPLQAQLGPVHQHSCPGYRPITQCQCGPHWLSARLQKCATDIEGNWSLLRKLVIQWTLFFQNYIWCIVNFFHNVLSNKLAAAPQPLYISAFERFFFFFTMLARVGTRVLRKL